MITKSELQNELKKDWRTLKNKLPCFHPRFEFSGRARSVQRETLPTPTVTGKFMPPGRIGAAIIRSSGAWFWPLIVCAAIRLAPSPSTVDKCCG
jgi:hypothetical protein